ncbi:hypothetical protein Naga_100150g4 [Nannochloropsis gaditana]|uniref:Secreted protein n=1 Tax=Nannochloropsis gaditana TaxID=72520 RepID=W7TR92_9STRA|nr:hypothetical protein Naga_100150g4 [Nannochloropsis gaditana]
MCGGFFSLSCGALSLKVVTTLLWAICRFHACDRGSNQLELSDTATIERSGRRNARCYFISRLGVNIHHSRIRDSCRGVNNSCHGPGLYLFREASISRTPPAFRENGGGQNHRKGLVRLSHEANGRARAGEGSNRVRKGKFLRKIRDTHRNVQLKMQQGVIIDDQACSEHVRGEREWRVSVGSGLRAEGGHIWDKCPEK